MKKNFIALLLCGALLLLPQTAAAENNTADISAVARQAEAAACSLLDSWYDNYFTYYTPDDFRLLTEDYVGTFGGIGITMLNNDEGNIVIYSIIDGSPASNSPIQTGDVIVSVDGENLLGCDSSQAPLLIRGEIGSEVTLVLRREGSEDFQVTLVRQEITTTSVTAELIEEIPHTAYFSISEFTGQTMVEFVQHYNELNQQETIENVIFDLRSNGGGTFSAAINVANYFVPEGEVIVSEHSADGNTAYKSNSGILRYCKVFILQNEWTASASEVLAGALRDQAGAVIFGTTSYGKGITQSVVPLPSGYGLRFTRSRYYTPSGYDLHGIGIPADVEVTLPDGISREEYFSTNPDQNPHLRAVIDYINNTQ